MSRTQQDISRARPRVDESPGNRMVRPPSSAAKEARHASGSRRARSPESDEVHHRLPRGLSRKKGHLAIMWSGHLRLAPPLPPPVRQVARATVRRPVPPQPRTKPAPERHPCAVIWRTTPASRAGDNPPPLFSGPVIRPDAVTVAKIRVKSGGEPAMDRPGRAYEVVEVTTPGSSQAVHEGNGNVSP